MSAASLKAVSDILGDLENAEASSGGAVKRKTSTEDSACGQCKNNSSSSSSNGAQKQQQQPQRHPQHPERRSLMSTVAGSSSSRVVPSKTSRSLVVDVHLPPDSGDDRDGGREEGDNCAEDGDDGGGGEVVLRRSGGQGGANGGSSASAPKPCKHSVNRFQRCYSDNSHSSSPKKKRKVCKQLKLNLYGGSVCLFACFLSTEHASRQVRRARPAAEFGQDRDHLRGLVVVLGLQGQQQRQRRKQQLLSHRSHGRRTDVRQSRLPVFILHRVRRPA